MNRSDLLRRLRALWRCAGGAVVVEAALLLPLMALGVVAALDVGRYLELNARADRIAAGMADLVSRADTIRDRAAFDALSQSTDLGVYFELARVMAEPEVLGVGGGVVLSSITGGATGATVNWMRAQGSGANASAARLQALAPLPQGMPFVVAEVFLPFDPLILDREALLGAVGFDRAIYRRALFRPRSAALTTLAQP